VKKLHILEWPFIVPSIRCTCLVIMLFNKLLDMPHLSDVWIILAKDKYSLKGYKHICAQHLREIRFCVGMEHFWNLLFQLMKINGTNTLNVFFFKYLWSLHINCHYGSLTNHSTPLGLYIQQVTSRGSSLSIHFRNLCGGVVGGGHTIDHNFKISKRAHSRNVGYL
jgi:hypothetical protein